MGDLGSNSPICANLVRKTFKAISPEPKFHFSQTGSHFNHNSKMNTINLSRAVICLHLRDMFPSVYESHFSDLLKNWKNYVTEQLVSRK